MRSSAAGRAGLWRAPRSGGQGHAGTTAARRFARTSRDSSHDCVGTRTTAAVSRTEPRLRGPERGRRTRGRAARARGRARRTSPRRTAATAPSSRIRTATALRRTRLSTLGSFSGAAWNSRRTQRSTTPTVADRRDDAGRVRARRRTGSSTRARHDVKLVPARSSRRFEQARPSFSSSSARASFMWKTRARGRRGGSQTEGRHSVDDHEPRRVPAAASTRRGFHRSRRRRRARARTSHSFAAISPQPAPSARRGSEPAARQARERGRRRARTRPVSRRAQGRPSRAGAARQPISRGRQTVRPASSRARSLSAPPDESRAPRTAPSSRSKTSRVVLARFVGLIETTAARR